MNRPEASKQPKKHYAVMAGFLGWTFDAFDFFILTFVIDDVAKTFGKSRPEIALTIALALCLRPIGALVFGVMADRIGRRVPLMLNVLFYAIISVLSGWAPNYQIFLILRMLFGIAMGGQWGVGASLALESVSPKCRGLLSGVLQEGYTLGNLLAAVAFRIVYPAYGWRILFYLGGLPALLSLFIFSKVKESPVWHEHRSDWKTYRSSALRHWRRFLYLALLMGMVGFMAHGTQDMYPTFLRRDRLYSARLTADIIIVSMIGAMLGGLAFGFLSDKFGRKRAMVTAALAGLVVVPLWIAAPNVALCVAGVSLMQFFVQGAAGIIPVQMIELTPGNLRGVFPGLAYQVGVVFASSITFFEAVLGEHLTYAQAMGSLAAIVLLASSVVFALGPENKGISFSKEPV
jgi:SHS family lactate transporter-like MFS transporter